MNKQRMLPSSSVNRSRRAAARRLSVRLLLGPLPLALWFALSGCQIANSFEPQQEGRVIRRPVEPRRGATATLNDGGLRSQRFVAPRAEVIPSNSSYSNPHSRARRVSASYQDAAAPPYPVAEQRVTSRRMVDEVPPRPHDMPMPRRDHRTARQQRPDYLVQGPVLQGTHLEQQSPTALETALMLKEENFRLRAELAKSKKKSENLAEELRLTIQSLNLANQAIDDSSQELVVAQKEIAFLHDKVEQIYLEMKNSNADANQAISQLRELLRATRTTTPSMPASDQGTTPSAGALPNPINRTQPSNEAESMTPPASQKPDTSHLLDDVLR